MKNVKEAIQMHLDKARQLAADAGMELEDFMGEQPGEMEEEGEEESDMPMGPGPDRGKIALIVAKMKKAKGE
jgi:hypothetical protein